MNLARYTQGAFVKNKKKAERQSASTPHAELVDAGITGHSLKPSTSSED